MISKSVDNDQVVINYKLGTNTFVKKYNLPQKIHVTIPKITNTLYDVDSIKIPFQCVVTLLLIDGDPVLGKQIVNHQHPHNTIIYKLNDYEKKNIVGFDAYTLKSPIYEAFSEDNATYGILFSYFFVALILVFSLILLLLQ